MGQMTICKTGFQGAQLALGDLGQVTVSDIQNEIRYRGYIRGAEPTPSVPSPGSTVRVRQVTVAMAVEAGVTDSLKAYGYPARCSMQIGSGGSCYIREALFDVIVTYAKTLADLYYARDYIVSTAQPTYSYTQPVSSPYTYQNVVPYSPSGATSPAPRTQLPAYSFTLFGDNLGQLPTPPAVPPATNAGMSSAEKMAFALQIMASFFTTFGNYYQAKAERERLQAMGQQIPQLTAAEIAALLQQYNLINPQSGTKTAEVAAGLFGQPKPSETPTWLYPALAFGGALMVMTMIKRR